MTMFRVGQKVVCINAACWGYGTRWFQGEEPIEGQIYTVRRSFIGDEGDRILWLDEIQRTEKSRQIHGEDVGYFAGRFRPVVERKTDISIFTDRVNKGQLEKVG